MLKKFILLFILIPSLLLIACNESGQGTGEDLGHLKMPEKLVIMDPESTTRSHELYLRGQEIAEDFNMGEEMTDSERERYEEKMEPYIEELDRFQEQIQEMDDRELIADLFERIKDAANVYDDGLDMEMLKAGGYYSIEANYPGDPAEHRSLKEGYVAGMILTKEDSLYVWGLPENRQDPEAIMLRLDIDYQWFDEKMHP